MSSTEKLKSGYDNKSTIDNTETDKKSKAQMSELFKTDKRAFRTCILYEAVTETPVEEAFNRLKKLKPTLDYLDFEYWYFRFLNGNEDLDHDKSTDPKTREFSDMPIDVVERIVGKLNAMDWLSLRKVSRTLRTIVDRNRCHCESVRIRCGDKTSELSIDNNKSIKYKHAKKGFTDLTFHRFPQKSVQGCHWEMAMRDFSTFFLNPNWTFKTVKIDFGWNDSIISFSENSKIHVEDFDIASGSMRTVAAILPHLNSDVLKKLRLWTKDVHSTHLETIATMDQWKKAEELHFNGIPDWFDIKNLFHTKKFSSKKCHVTEERLEAIRDILFNSPTFEYCSLRDVRDYFEFFERIDVTSLVNDVMGAHAVYDPVDMRYPIDGSDDYFKISYRDGSVEDDDFFLEIKRIRA